MKLLATLLAIIVLIALSPVLMVIGMNVWANSSKRPGRRGYGP